MSKIDLKAEVEYPFKWKPDEQGRDLLSTVCECHMDNDGQLDNFRLKIEVEGKLKTGWENLHGPQDFDKLVHWIVREHLTKLRFTPRREKSGFVEIPSITYDQYPQIPCTPDVIDIVPGEPFIVEIPDPPFGSSGFHSKK